MTVAGAKGTVATYLLARLEALGIEHLFNVSGSYCSGLLASLETSRVKAVFTAYEMEAAYAADAYARIKGFGAICTTYGPGASSALNGIVGAFVEHCPVVIINGGPSPAQLELQLEYGVMFLHSTGPLKTDLALYAQVTAATAVVDRAETAPAEIDRVLTALIEQKRPVYLEISQDLWTQPCPRPVGTLQAEPATVDKDAVCECLDDAVARIASARRPLFWAGEEIDRWGLQPQFAALLGTGGIPYVTTLAAKSLLPETTAGFLGVYDGRFAPPDLRKTVEAADFVIALGTIFTDFVGDIVTRDYGRMTLASQSGVRIGHHLYPDVTLADFIGGLTERLAGTAASPAWATPAAGQSSAGPLSSAETPITFDLLFAAVADFVQDKLVIADTGLSLFAAASLPMSAQKAYVSQSVWMSIGYSLGASVGAAFASGKRPVVFVGDAAFREGSQTLSTLVQYKIPAVICVMNNGIMGVQQFMGDPKYYEGGGAPDYYNVLRRWNYEALARGFGARHARASTVGEFGEALAQAAAHPDETLLIDVVLDEKDLPAVIRQAIGNTAPQPVQANFETPLFRRSGPT
jgi:indolepyruvate decarboxylase